VTNGKPEKFTSTWNPKNQPTNQHAKTFYKRNLRRLDISSVCVIL